MKSILVTVLALLLCASAAQSLESSDTEPELIYSSYTNTPSFYCPTTSFKCVLYQTTGRWTQLDEPILKAECGPGEVCRFTSTSRRGGFIRWLPGDLWTSAFHFDGYKLYDDNYPVFSQPEEPEDEPAEPESEPEEAQCIKQCTRKSIHGICMSYRMVC
jgi:hypothetical protein